MPTYLEPLHGVSLSEAYAEAAAVAPIQRVMLRTYELRHPSLAAPVRIVADQQALFATLEDDAPEDPSAEVEFLASAVEIDLPEESDTAESQTVKLRLDNVAGLMSEALRAARGSRVPWELTERLYASDDTTAPAILPPLTLVLSSVSLDVSTAVLTASYGDPANVAIPRATFTKRDYPGL